MPESDVTRILNAFDEFRKEFGAFQNKLTKDITSVEERQHQHARDIDDHKKAIIALEATRALTAELDATRSRIKVLEDNALVEQGKRKAWGVVAVAISTILGLVIKLL